MSDIKIPNSLSKIFDEDNSLRPPNVSEYSIDGRDPSIVVFPENEDEISMMLKHSQSDGGTIVPWGAGTLMGLGNLPKRIDAVVSTRNLNQILNHDPEDLTVTVQSGMTLDDLQYNLAKKGQFLPLDPPRTKETTIGGIVATNSSGPRRISYGTSRDILLGIRVAHPSGDITKGGGRVVKNVAGYDMTKLYIGSLGTLGIILEMCFKVLPLPEFKSTLLIPFSSLSCAMRFINELMKSRIIPSAFELIDSKAVQYVMKEDPKEPKKDFLVVLSFEGNFEEVDYKIKKICEISSENSSLVTQNLIDNDHEDFWKTFEELPHRINISYNNSILCRSSILPNKVSDMLEATELITSKYQLNSLTYSHVGSGVVYTHFLINVLGMSELKNAVNCINELRTTAILNQGNLVLERAPVRVKEKVDVWGKILRETSLMKALKHKFDPKGILNPGRYVAGI